MPLRLLRFCRRCLTTRQTAMREACEACGGDLLPLLDANGALSRDFLLARGSCCDTGCRNCPYRKAGGASCTAPERAREDLPALSGAVRMLQRRLLVRACPPERRHAGLA